jgi:hypothetical protein
MIEFFKKNQKNITMGGAIALLLICFFQQKELAKLRKESMVIKEIETSDKTKDSLIKKVDLIP